MSQWHYFPLDIPADQDIVWIRLIYSYSTAFLAQYVAADQCFISQENDIIFPAWTIFRWKAQ